MSADKMCDVCFIRAKLKDDYVFDAIRNYGFDINIPFKDYNIMFRLARELWFKLRLPFKDIWYNKVNIRNNSKIYVFYDPLIIPELIEWVHRKKPSAKIILLYGNRANMTINPNQIPPYVEKWSYDEEDCTRYKMNFIHPYYFDIYRFDASKEEKEIDVLYVGRDKGRLDNIIKYENQFNDLGLITHFHICADRAYMKYKKKEYKPIIPYSNYLELLKQSKAILNIVQKNQVSITQRELEAVFYNVKCITTNVGIKKFELYDTSRYFVLGEDDISELPDFINSKFKKVDEELLNEYKYIKVINSVIGKD